MFKNETRDKSFLLALVFFFIAVCIRFVLSDFIKVIHCYPDELRYYGLARSIFMGKGLSLRNMDSGFQKIGYSLLIAPFFAIRNGFFRIKIISLFNCILMSVSVFPARLIGKELKLNEKNIFLLLLLTLIWPDMILSMSFMSEILYWPVVLTFAWLWIRVIRERKLWQSALLGFVCYAGYLCKDIFLAYFLAAFAFFMLSPLLSFYLCNEDKKKVLSFYSKKDFLNIEMFALVFIGLYFIFKLTFFKGLGSSYEKFDILGVGAIKNLYNFSYMILGFFIYLSAIILAVFFFPIVYPALYYRKLSKEGQSLFLFSVLSILIISTTVAYTIMVREDLGLFLPAIHLRYVAPIFVICMAVFIELCQKNILDGERFGFTSLFLLLSIVFVSFLFKGLGSTPVVSWCSLAWYKIPQKLFGSINKGYDFVLRPYVIVVNFCFMMAVFILHFLKEKKGSSAFLKGFMPLCFMLLISGNAVALKLIKEGYGADKEIISELESIDDFFQNEKNFEDSDTPHILYVSAGYIATENSYFDTYFDAIGSTYMVSDIELLLTNGELLSGFKFKEPESENVYDISEIEYVIIPTTLSVECKDAMIRSDLSGKHYTVYENKNPSRLFVVQKPCRSYNFDWNLCVSNGFDKDGCRYINPNGDSYGPYWHVQKGAYEIKIEGENLAAANIKLCAAKGAVTYPFKSEYSNNSIILNFSLESEISDFEIFIENKSTEIMKLTSLELRQE